jgi:hypothetical protein
VLQGHICIHFGNPKSRSTRLLYVIQRFTSPALCSGTGKSLLKVWGGKRSLAQTGFHIHRNSRKGNILLTRTVRAVVCYESTESKVGRLFNTGDQPYLLSSNKQRMPGFDGVPRSLVHAGVPSSTPVGHGKVEQSGVRATRYIAVVPVTSLVFSSW